jgi:hypothetical protein
MAQLPPVPASRPWSEQALGPELLLSPPACLTSQAWYREAPAASLREQDPVQDETFTFFSANERSQLMALFKPDPIFERQLPKAEELPIRANDDLTMACQRTALKLLLLADFDGPVVRGEPQRRQLVASVAALLEHYAGSSP